MTVKMWAAPCKVLFCESDEHTEMFGTTVVSEFVDHAHAHGLPTPKINERRLQSWLDS